MKKEIWKDIRGYKNKYQASNLGRVKSLARLCNSYRGPRKIKERILKTILCSSGYLQVVLCKNGKPQPFRIHRLIIETLGPRKPSKKHECNHKDGIKIHNELSNLEWVTRKGNVHHAYQKGLHTKKKMPSTKEIGEIKKLHVPYKVTIKDLAKKYGVGTDTVSRIVNNRISIRDF